MSKERITLERVYKASIDEVWDLWTTKEGIESWWGPDGFRVEVHAIDLRAGGKLTYAMIASAAPQIEFMKQHGMPIVTEAQITYTAVSPKTRLAYDHLADFIPGVEAYSVIHTVELFPKANEVRMVLTIDRMHNEEWTNRAVMGWESELGKLDKVLTKKNEEKTS